MVFDFVEHCTVAMLDFLPVSHAAFYLLDECYRPSACFTLGKTPKFQGDAYLQRFWRNDPLLPTVLSDAESPVRALSHVLTEPRQLEVNDYIAFIRREGCIDALKIDFVFNGRIVGGVAMGRSELEGPFSNDEVALLQKCAKLTHVASAYGDGSERHQGAIRAYHFTPRESEIVTMIRRGATNRDIAERFDIGVATVKTHLINIFEKVGVTSRTSLLSELYF